MDGSSEAERLFRASRRLHRFWMLAGVYVLAAAGVLSALRQGGWGGGVLVLAATGLLCAFTCTMTSLLLRLTRQACPPDEPLALDLEEPPQEEPRLEEGFLGLGLSGMEPGRVDSVSPFGPAAAAGLRPGDRILRVGDQNLAALDSRQAAQLFRGLAGTRVTVLVARPGTPEPLVYSLVRRARE